MCSGERLRLRRGLRLGGIWNIVRLMGGQEALLCYLSRRLGGEAWLALLGRNIDHFKGQRFLQRCFYLCHQLLFQKRSPPLHSTKPIGNQFFHEMEVCTKSNSRLTHLGRRFLYRQPFLCTPWHPRWLRPLRRTPSPSISCPGDSFHPAFTDILYQGKKGADEIEREASPAFLPRAL